MSGYWHQRWFQTMAYSVLLLGIIYVLPPVVSDPFRFAITVVTQPVERVFSFLGFKIGETFSSFASIATFKEENARLLADNLALQSDNARLHDVEKENTVLREQLGAPKDTRWDTVAAEVIGRDAEGSGRWIAINRGTIDGLTKGMAVVVGGGILVGQVDEVSLTSAKVLVLTHPDSVVNVTDEVTSARGVVRGEYGLGIVLDMVPQTDALNIGDRIITSGLGGTLPPSLVVGTLGDIRQTPDRLFQQAAIRPVIATDQVRFVEVIRKF